MSRVLQQVEHQSGDDHQTRRCLSPETLFRREKDTALGLLVDYWRGVTQNGVVADSNDFRPTEVLPPEAARWVSWVDTRAESPLDYVWRNHIYAWEGERSRIYRDASGFRVRDYANRTNGRFCATEYHLCKSLKRPLYHEIEQWTGREHRHYLRVLLPVLDRHGDVIRLVYACRRI